MDQMILHEYWRSSAAYRVRIALNMKGQGYQSVPHDLRLGEQRDPAYRTVAPAGLVPAIEYEGNALVQSVAIIEWLEERWPEPALLPKTPQDRAIVRAMVATIAADIHPLNNLRVLKYLKAEFEASQQHVDQWIHHWIGEGFAALETMIGRYGDGFAFGDAPTMADCLVVPQLFNAERFGVDVSPYPRLVAAAANARKLPAFASAHPDLQPGAE